MTPHGEGRRAAGAPPGPADPAAAGKAKTAAFRLLERRAYTRAEVARKLKARGFAPGVIDETLATLERLGLVDDVDFARRLIRERLRTRPSGQALLRRDLARRGVEAAVIESALEEGFQDVDLESVAFRLLCRRRSRYLDLDRSKALNRMYGFLGRRGFPPDTARSAAHRALEAIAQPDASRGDPAAADDPFDA